ncbi:related to 4-coumarate--CoA ligase [Phialocephala subalpina]|uniref:Related to 4-coumarate--CoA ligase n=1 Tax=Phialocephala subalpina TaxID=576137 RepID=A0A1L7XKP4_9HELO|nr:related to 4-coumarate--CoA ligase [Phialocephala subalpina]
MALRSPFPDIEIPKCNVLSYLFPPDTEPSDEPIWIDSKNANISLSAAQLKQWVKRLAFGLTKAGLKRGDVVLIYTPNHIFVPAAYLGIVSGGFAFSELAHQLKDTQARILLTHPAMVKNAIAAAKQACLSNSHIFQFSDEENPTADGVKDWRHLIGTPSEAKTYSWPELTPEESVNTTATINYSSGTTGLPKGVCVSHHNLLANIQQTIFIKYHLKPFSFAKRPPERWIGFLPLYHAYGQLWTILMALKLQVPVYVMKKDDEGKDVSVGERGEIWIRGPQVCLGYWRNEEATKDTLVDGWLKTGDVGVRDERGWFWIVDRKRVSYVDDEGKDVSVGERGEIWIRGPQVCLGYWRNEEATKDTLVDGWLKTGDVGVRDERGWFWIVDRKREMIKVNAMQVAPAELEAVLLEHEHIADTAVEIAKGKVKSADVQEWIKPRVAKHKWLVGGVKFVDEVPKLASGKIVRKVMKEWAKADAEKLESHVKSRL